MNSNEENKKERLSKYICLQSKSSTSDDVQTDVFIDEVTEGRGKLFERNILFEYKLIFIIGNAVISPTCLARQIVLDKKIGVGGYGCVYRGKWYDDIIAVKIFSTNDAPSWVREVYIYETLGLNHENILRFIGADNIVNILPIRLND